MSGRAEAEFSVTEQTEENNRGGGDCRVQSRDRNGPNIHFVVGRNNVCCFVYDLQCILQKIIPNPAKHAEVMYYLWLQCHIIHLCLELVNLTVILVY